MTMMNLSAAFTLLFVRWTPQLTTRWLSFRKLLTNSAMQQESKLQCLHDLILSSRIFKLRITRKSTATNQRLILIKLIYSSRVWSLKNLRKEISQWYISEIKATSPMSTQLPSCKLSFTETNQPCYTATRMNLSHRHTKTATKDCKSTKTTRALSTTTG